MSKIYVDEIAGIASPSTVAIPGHVIQVVSTKYSTETVYSSTSVTSTNFSASITPSSTNSKILVMFTCPVRKNVTTAATGMSFYLYKDGSQLTVLNYWLKYYLGSEEFDQFTSNYVDSPNTTSQLTYDIRVQIHPNGGQFRLNDTQAHGEIILMEIAG